MPVARLTPHRPQKTSPGRVGAAHRGHGVDATGSVTPSSVADARDRPAAVAYPPAPGPLGRYAALDGRPPTHEVPMSEPTDPGPQPHPVPEAAAPAGEWQPPAFAGPPYAQAPAAAGPGMYHDPASGLVLPEGVQLASTARRIGAYFLAIPLMIVTLGIGYVIWGLVIWGRGQTPALQVLGMRCWRPETQSVPGFWWMALREVIGRLVDGVLSIISLALSFVLFLTTRERKSLHDYVAGTVVLHDPDRRLG